ncbi:MAG: ROK family protein [bacterium]
MFVGVDIGGTNIRLAVFDESFATVVSVRRNVRDVTAPQDLADRLVEMLADTGVPPGSVRSIGLGLAGQMSRDGKIIYNSPNLGWRDVRFAEVLGDALEGVTSAPIAVANDLNALLWGEYQAGAARGVANCMAMFVGTGVGGAMICDGELVNGAGGKAGELGHVKVARDGRLCGCGEFGCLEAYAGGIHLERQVAEILGGGKDLAEVDASVYETPAIRELWETVTGHLSLAMANAVTLLNPEVVVLGGGIFENLPNFRDMTLRKTTPLILSACRDDVRFEMARLGDQAGMLGAALLATR